MTIIPEQWDSNRDSSVVYSTCAFTYFIKCSLLTLGVPSSSLRVLGYPPHEAGHPGVDPGVLGVAALSTVAHDTELGHSEQLVCVTFPNIVCYFTFRSQEQREDLQSLPDMSRFHCLLRTGGSLNVEL